MADPYVYPGTNVLKNLLDIEDEAALRAFEIEATTQRIAEGFPNVALTSDGYQELHWHIFQDVYQWAGQIRTVNLAKESSMFCRVEYVERELRKLFERLAAENYLLNLSQTEFAAAAAIHLSELNAIHPFREGNGRTSRAFLRVLGDRNGHILSIAKIGPESWISASKDSFLKGDASGFEHIIIECMKE